MPKFVLICWFACGLIRHPVACAGELEDSIDKIRAAHGISATAYFIVSPNTVETLQSLGTMSWTTDVRFDVDHLVRIGSITKTFSALGALVLAERGSLSLNAPVSQVLVHPPFANPWADSQVVRIAHLIEHTAGLRDLSPKEFSVNHALPLAAALRIDPASRRLAWAPGLHSSYSNSGAGILSGIIEKVTGRPFETFIADEIFRPLGMSSAGFTVNSAARAHLITGHDRDGRTPIAYWHTLYRAFGGINVTPRDMIPFVQLFLNRGMHAGTQLLSMAAIDRMQTPATTLAAMTGLDYGYGLGIYQFQHRGISFYGHGGDADGYLAFFAYAPTLDRGYFVVINAFNSDALRAMRRIIENHLVGDTEPQMPSIARLTDRQRTILSGTYMPVTQRFTDSKDGENIDVVVDNDRLYTRVGTAQRLALLPVSDWHFRRRTQSVATIAFIPCGERLYLQGAFGNYAKDISGARLAPCPPAVTEAQAVTTQRTPVPASVQ